MMNNNTSTAVQDYRLLLHQLKNAAFDQEGDKKAAAILTDNSFRQSLPAEDALTCARIAQMHGQHDTALKIFANLHEQHPELGEAWSEHAAILDLLGKKAELAALRARAGQVLSADRLNRIFPNTAAEKEKKDDTDAWISDPFTRLHRQEEQLVRYMEIFSGRADAFARQWRDNKTGGQGYVPVRRPMQTADIRDHLSGRRTYGIYLMQSENMVSVGVIDIDMISKFRDRKLTAAERHQLRREGIYLLGRLRELGAEKKMSGIAEFSGGKGYHFWYPVRHPVPAKCMRASLYSIVDQLKNDVTCFSMEVFPKQDSLSGKGYGNLVKLPLGIHRQTGKPSWFLDARQREIDEQLAFLAGVKLIDPAVIEKTAARPSARVMMHPRHEQWAGKYPELAELQTKCSMLGQIIASVRQAKSLNVREEKILLGTLAHLPRSRVLLHHLFSFLPEYNRPLLDYHISKVRGTPLGCKRIHSLMEDGGASLPCHFDKAKGYPHPLLHFENFKDNGLPKAEKIENFQAAVDNLKAAIIEFERFLPG